MALNYVSLTCDLYDGSGAVITTGTATFTPSVQLTDATDHELITLAPVTASFRPASSPVVSLLATDNAAPLPGGWAWTVTFTGVPGNPASFSFFLPFASGASQFLSGQAPVSAAVTLSPALALVARTAAAGYTLVNGTGTVLSWTAPNDGAQHRVVIFATMDVTSGTTGGQMSATITAPDGTATTPQLFAASQTTGVKTNNLQGYIVQAGSTSTVRQNSAMSAGAAVFWADVWAL